MPLLFEQIAAICEVALDHQQALTRSWTRHVRGEPTQTHVMVETRPVDMAGFATSKTEGAVVRSMPDITLSWPGLVDDWWIPVPEPTSTCFAVCMTFEVLYSD